MHISNTLLETGIIILFGFLCGELAQKAKLPKVSGYIIAGVLLNPDISGIISNEFINSSSTLINIALAFITFSIGGSLSWTKIRESGKMIIVLTTLEAMFAFLIVTVISYFAIYPVFRLVNSWQLGLAMALILGALASPTDPSATLAVKNEYHAKGKVSSTVLEIAAFDDIFGIILYTLSVAFANTFIGDVKLEPIEIVKELSSSIGGSVIIGIFAGWLFNLATKIFNQESAGELIVLISGFLIAIYGISSVFHFDELLSTMTLGVMIVNFNSQRDRIFSIIEQYTDELIFVIFFTLSGLHLQFSSISGSLLLIGFFVLARFAGKFSGIYTGAVMTKAPASVRRYTAGGLFPQGGIVIGLALLLTKNASFDQISNQVVGIVIGAAVIHEILGPIIAKYFLKKAGDID